MPQAIITATGQATRLLVALQLCQQHLLLARAVAPRLMQSLLVQAVTAQSTVAPICLSVYWGRPSHLSQRCRRQQPRPPLRLQVRRLARLLGTHMPCTQRSGRRQCCLQSGAASATAPLISKATAAKLPQLLQVRQHRVKPPQLQLGGLQALAAASPPPALQPQLLHSRLLRLQPSPVPSLRVLAL